MQHLYLCRKTVAMSLSRSVILIEILSSPIDLQTRVNSALDNYMTLTFDLLTSGSIFALYVY